MHSFLLLNNEDVAYVLVVLDRAMASPRSSISSDHQLFTGCSRNLPTAPATPGRDLEGDHPGLSTDGGFTDPATIHAITQTMIGEFLYKYTHRTIGKKAMDKLDINSSSGAIRIQKHCTGAMLILGLRMCTNPVLRAVR